MVLAKAFNEYVANIKVALLFALLLLFVPVFIMPFFGSGIFLSSGTLFLEYELSQYSVIQILLAIIFLAPFSFFVSLVVFGVRRDLSKVKVEFYLDEMIKKFSFRLFLFYSLLFLLFFGVSLAVSTASAYAVFIAYIAMLIIGLLFLFVPQALVVDEVTLRNALLESVSFVKRNPKSAFIVLFVGSALLAIVALIEYLLDLFFIELFVGEFVALLMVLIFVVPFIEVLKTYLYMLKFHLIKKSESVG